MKGLIRYDALTGKKFPETVNTPMAFLEYSIETIVTMIYPRRLAWMSNQGKRHARARARRRMAKRTRRG